MLAFFGACAFVIAECCELDPCGRDGPVQPSRLFVFVVRSFAAAVLLVLCCPGARAPVVLCCWICSGSAAAFCCFAHCLVALVVPLVNIVCAVCTKNGYHLLFVAYLVYMCVLYPLYYKAFRAENTLQKCRCQFAKRLGMAETLML